MEKSSIAAELAARFGGREDGLYDEAASAIARDGRASALWASSDSIDGFLYRMGRISEHESVRERAWGLLARVAGWSIPFDEARIIDSFIVACGRGCLRMGDVTGADTADIELPGDPTRPREVVVVDAEPCLVGNWDGPAFNRYACVRLRTMTIEDARVYPSDASEPCAMDSEVPDIFFATHSSRLLDPGTYEVWAAPDGAVVLARITDRVRH